MTTIATQSPTGPVTTRFSGAKQWAWSYSKLKNFEICPYRHQQIDLLKAASDTGGENMLWGNRVHACMAARLAHKTPLPVEMIDYDKFAKRIEDKQKLFNGTLLVEQKYAITVDFKPTGYFAPNVWYRGIGDVLLLAPPVALIGDWKTGRLQDDPIQLALMAQCVFSFYENIEKVATRFIWLKEHAETDETFTRDDLVKLWPRILDRVGYMERAAQTNDYPAKPNGLCRKYCPVKACVYHGKGNS